MDKQLCPGGHPGESFIISLELKEFNDVIIKAKNAKRNKTEDDDSYFFGDGEVGGDSSFNAIEESKDSGEQKDENTDQ